VQGDTTLSEPGRQGETGRPAALRRLLRVAEYLRYPERGYIRLKRSALARLLDPAPVPAAPPEPLPRIVWMFWDTGEAAAPPLVRACIGSWRDRNPGWEVRLLSRADMEDAVDIADLAHVRPVAQFSDILRTRLLLAHGGVWADATTWCALPLDHWLPPLMAGEMFLFRTPGPDRLVSSWFIAARPGGPALRALSAIVTRHWTGRSEGTAYYSWHYLVEYLARTHPAMRRALRWMPAVSAEGSHRLQRWLREGRAGAAPALTGIPVHKLNWRDGFDPEEVRRLAG